MKKINNILLASAFLVAFFIVGCSDDSDILTPSQPETNNFMVDPSKTDDQSLLRRDFYEKTGIHLLFTDTLSKADDNVELIDFNWNFNTYSSEPYRFTYMEDLDAMQKAADIMADYFVPYIKDGKCKPYSMLIVDQAEIYDYSYDYWEYMWIKQPYISNWRCFAVSASDWADLQPEEYRDAGYDLLQSFIFSQLTYRSSEMSEFMSINKDVYWEYVEDYIPGFFDDEEDISLIYAMGFLSYDDYWESFPGESDDFEDYKALVFEHTEDEVMEMYGNYSKVIQKYNLMKQAIADLGINLNAEIK